MLKDILITVFLLFIAAAVVVQALVFVLTHLLP